MQLHDELNIPLGTDSLQLISHICRRIIPHLSPLGCRVYLHLPAFLGQYDRMSALYISHGRY